MTLYVDTSALLKRYIDEQDSAVAQAHLSSDPVLVTSRLTEVELRRSLTRLLKGKELDDKRRAVSVDLDAFALVALDTATMNAAARIAEQTLCRSLDAIHIGATQRAGSSTALLTFDHRQARAARDLGITVLGA